MDPKLRKLDTKSLVRKARQLASDLDATLHPLLKQAWDTVETDLTALTQPKDQRKVVLDWLDELDRSSSSAAGIMAPAPVIPASWTAMQAALEDHEYAYPAIQFPATPLAGKPGAYEFANGVIASWTELGLGYMSERVPSVKYAVWTELFRNGKWDQVDQLFADHATELNGKSFVAAMIDGEIVGVMSHYQPVKHADLLDLFVKENLPQHLRRWDLTQTHLELDLKVADITSNLVAVLRVRNGHSGHFALRFTAALVSEGYDWEAGGAMRRGRRRHLSNVSEVIEGLKTAMDDAASILFDQNLRAITFDQALDIITLALPRLTLRQEQLLQQAKSNGASNALELVSFVAPYGATRGWAAAVAGVLDPVVVKAAGL